VAALGELAQGGRVGRIAQRVARLHPAAIGLAEQCLRIGQRRLAEIAAGETRQPLRHHEAFIGKALDAIEQR